MVEARWCFWEGDGEVGAAGFGGDESWEEGAEFISDFSTC
jgi:hypothetical protein